jgi:hypothetical protein
MVRTRKLYPCLALLVAIICFIFLSNCGGGGNSSLVPNTNPTTENPVSYTNPTPTPVLTNVSVSGYIYCNNITTEDGETIPRINVMDVPAYQSDSSGNESFLTQVSNSIKADYPEDWATSDIQELYTQLNKTLSESKPLPEYNVQAQVYSVYNDTSIPISSDGHFDNTVLTGSTDSTVKLEVALGEDNYAEVETLPSSGDINSSDATSAAELKSCPEKIFAFPGEIVIFKVYSEPGINLKSAGLKFALNNPSIGCITQPLYLCLFGAHKYQVAYGCVYIKPGLDTPVDTTITARLNSGQSMNIFLEVIKKTSSVSGTVYTGGSPLVKGYVKSLGPKACCKIDSSGAYSLPKVFRGHSRSVIATWWTSENGQKIRHREEKVIDFLNADVSGFNFGVPPTPTPTSTPTATPTPHEPGDPYYDKGVSKVLGQFQEWEKELGSEEAVRNTVKWLNREIQGPPIPEEIKEAIKVLDDDYEFWILFVDGQSVKIRVKPFDNIMFDISSVSSQFSPNYIEKQNDKLSEQSSLSSYKLYSSDVISPSSSKILILGMNIYEDQFKWTTPRTYAFSHTVYGELANDLIKNGYDVKRKIITLNDIEFRTPTPDPSGELIQLMDLKKPSSNISPYDLSNLGEYGVIYIATHGTPPHKLSTGTYEPGALSCGVLYENDLNTHKWMKDNSYHKYSPWPWPYLGCNNTWYTTYVGTQKGNRMLWTEHLMLTPYFFKSQKFDNSIIFLPICYSAANALSDPTFADYPSNDFLCKGFENRCLVYIGCDDEAADVWSQLVPYYYFYYMMYGFKQPNLPIPTTYDLSIPKDSPGGYQWPDIGQEVTPDTNSPPLSAREAYNALEGLIIDQNIYQLNSTTLDTHKTGCMMNIHIKNDNTYFPIPVSVTVEKNNKK